MVILYLQRNRYIVYVRGKRFKEMFIEGLFRAYDVFFKKTTFYMYNKLNI